MQHTTQSGALTPAEQAEVRGRLALPFGLTLARLATRLSAHCLVSAGAGRPLHFGNRLVIRRWLAAATEQHAPPATEPADDNDNEQTTIEATS